MALYTGRNAALIMHKDGQKNRKCEYKLSKSYSPILLQRKISLWNHRKPSREPQGSAEHSLNTTALA